MSSDVAPSDIASAMLDLAPLFAARPGLARLFAALDGEGEEARIVGGAVRDLLVGRVEADGLPRGDIDLATTATPDVVTARVRAAGLKAIPTGIEHGTVTVVADGQPYEVTTLREDVATDGRRAQVAFGRDWRHDAERRDFTMNALYLTRTGELVDIVGGVADARAGRVRFIGDADRRIAEDYLRILRLFRFHAGYGRGPLDGEALAAAQRGRAGLDQLSRERVRAELMKLLVAERAPQTLAEMDRAGLLVPVLGQPADVAAFARLAAIEDGLGLPPDAVRRLGVLADGVEDWDRFAQSLRLSRAEAGRLAAMAGPVPAPEEGEPAAKAALYRLGAATYRDRVLAGWARAGAAPEEPGWRVLATLPERWEPPRFPLKAADFLAEGLAPGPALGAAMKQAEAGWIAAGFPLDTPALDALRAAALREG